MSAANAAPQCPRCRSLDTVVEHETFHLGANKVPVTFVRTRCRTGPCVGVGFYTGCGHVFATLSQSACNQRKVRHAIPSVRLPIAWPHGHHDLGD